MRSTAGGEKEKVEFVAWENDNLRLRRLSEYEKVEELEATAVTLTKFVSKSLR
jgi:hypothetical protein